MQRIALALAVVTSALAAAPLALAAAKPQTVTVTITNAKLALSPKAHPGTITFRLVNKGKVARTFRIDGKTSKLVDPTKTGTLVVTLKKGSYPYLSMAKGKTKLSGTLKISA
jgi:hypothetical protein